MEAEKVKVYYPLNAQNLKELPLQVESSGSNSTELVTSACVQATFPSFTSVEDYSVQNAFDMICSEFERMSSAGQENKKLTQFGFLDGQGDEGKTVEGLQSNQSEKTLCASSSKDSEQQIPNQSIKFQRLQTIRNGSRVELPVIDRESPLRHDFCADINAQQDIQYPPKSYLGEGSFGKVYKGVWRGKKVAVKIFKEEYQTVLDRESTRLFESEFDIMARLQHENIVECFGGNKAIQSRVIIMEYMDQGSLDNFIHKNPHPIKMLHYYKTLVCISKALVYLHPTIVHRDIKPQNILINKLGHVKVADFGLSKFKEATTRLSSNMGGTPHYVAPEVLTGTHRTGPKVDIFSVGVLMWEMYTRKRPWYGHKDFQIAYNVMTGERPKIPEGCLEDLSVMIKRCWDPDPDQRPTAEELYTWAKEQVEIETKRQVPILLHKQQQV